MKKILIGCGIVALIAFVLVGSCVGFFFYQAMKLGQGFEAAIADVSRLNQDYPFTEPVEGTEFESGRFDDYLVVRRAVIDRTMEVPVIGTMLVSIRQAEQTDAPVEEPALGAMDGFRMIGDIPRALSDIARHFDSRQMSIDEYVWISRGVYEAIHTGAQLGDEEMEEMWDQLRVQARDLTRTMTTQGGIPQDEFDFDLMDKLDAFDDRTAPEANVALVREHRDELLESPALAIAELFILQVMQQLAESAP